MSPFWLTAVTSSYRRRTLSVGCPRERCQPGGLPALPGRPARWEASSSGCADLPSPLLSPLGLHCAPSIRSHELAQTHIGLQKEFCFSPGDVVRVKCRLNIWKELSAYCFLSGNAPCPSMAE